MVTNISLRNALIVILLVVACQLHLGSADYCHGVPHPNAQPNMNPIYDYEPILVNVSANGKLYHGMIDDTVFTVLHVWGSPYEMGMAHGVLLRSRLQVFIKQLWAYMESQVTVIMKKVPEDVARIIANEGLDVALDMTYDATKRYTGEYFYEEIRGIADGAGIDYFTLRRIHLIGELTKGACSMYGAWGTATPSGSTLQLRALDWDVAGPYKDFPMVIVYHPEQGHPFTSVGFIGWIGCLAGMSSSQLAISEIGVSFPDSTFGEESRFGVPFTFLMRDILQFDKTVDDSISRIANAHRTCNLILGVGDGKLGHFRGFQYSHSVANVIDDLNLIPVNDTWHPKIKNVVYFGMDWLCPGYTKVLAAQLSKFYGNITGENTIRYITPIVQTGDVHIVISDLTNLKMWVGFAANSTQSGPKFAYDRSFIAFDAKTLFDEQPPFIHQEFFLE